jgi:hypothetical protein
VQPDAIRIDIGAGDEIIDDRSCDALGVGRSVEFAMAQRYRRGRDRRRR